MTTTCEALDNSVHERSRRSTRRRLISAGVVGAVSLAGLGTAYTLRDQARHNLNFAQGYLEITQEQDAVATEQLNDYFDSLSPECRAQIEILLGYNLESSSDPPTACTDRSDAYSVGRFLTENQDQAQIDHASAQRQLMYNESTLSGRMRGSYPKEFALVYGSIALIIAVMVESIFIKRARRTQPN